MNLRTKLIFTFLSVGSTPAFVFLYTLKSYFFVTFCSFFIKLFTKSLFAGWCFDTQCVKIRCFTSEGSLATFVTFFSNIKVEKTEFLENMWFYKIEPHIFQKFSFFHLFFLEKKTWICCQSSFIKHQIVTQVPKNQLSYFTINTWKQNKK